MQALATDYTALPAVQRADTIQRKEHCRHLLLSFVVGALSSACGAYIFLGRHDVGMQLLPAAAPKVPTVMHKMAVDLTTPVELQLTRGTCWVFAAVDVLEWTYRQQGLAHGWLEPDRYVRMSEQAFGIAVLDACFQLKGNASCVVGDEVWRGRQLMPANTQGGDPALLYYLASLGQTSALPWSICPVSVQF